MSSAGWAAARRQSDLQWHRIGTQAAKVSLGSTSNSLAQSAPSSYRAVLCTVRKSSSPAESGPDKNENLRASAPGVQNELGQDGHHDSESNTHGQAMPGEIPLHPFALEIFRGMGQVVFCNSTLTGAAITAGLLLGDPKLAVLGLLGCTTATATARVIGANAEATSAGLLGYNGALVGCAFSVFLDYPPGIVAAATVGGSAASAVLASKLGSFTAPVPQWTWAFNIIVLGSLAMMKGPANDDADAEIQPVRFGELDPLAWTSAFFAGVSQIFLVDNAYSGALMVAGIASYSPFAAAATLGGSALGALSGLFFCKDAAEVEAGLWGFNPALTALAVSVFFVPTGPQYAALVCGGAVVAAIATIGVKAGFQSTVETPCCTVPFCIIASAAFLLGGRVPGLVHAKIPHSPEVNLRAFRSG